MEGGLHFPIGIDARVQKDCDHLPRIGCVVLADTWQFRGQAVHANGER